MRASLALSAPVVRSAPHSFAAKAAGLFLRAVARTLNVTVVEETQRSVKPGSQRIFERGATVAILHSALPTLYPFWNAHSLLLLSSYLAVGAPHDSVFSFSAVADDSFGGRFTQSLLRCLKLPYQVLEYCDPIRRLETLKLILEEMPTLVMAADSHGPYRSISLGMARLAKAYPAVRPIGAWCDRFLPLFGKIKMALPLPGARICVTVAAPLELSALQVGAVRDLMEKTLGRLEVSSADRIVGRQ